MKKEDKVKIIVLMVAYSVVLIAQYVYPGKEPSLTYNPVPPRESFLIGAFNPSKTEYNFRHYDKKMAVAFLASVNNRFSEGDIVAVDGLKWKKNEGEWEAFPNPPIPVFKQGDNIQEHVLRYAEWIDNHPHFGYPPIPMENKK